MYMAVVTCNARERERQTETHTDTQLVSWCFEPSQPQRFTSGPQTRRQRLRQTEMSEEREMKDRGGGGEGNKNVRNQTTDWEREFPRCGEIFDNSWRPVLSSACSCRPMS